MTLSCLIDRGAWKVYVCVCVCVFRRWEGGQSDCVPLCMSVWMLCGGEKRWWEFFRTKVGGRGRRVDVRMGESRGRSVRVKREEEGVGVGVGVGGRGAHPLILSPSP